MSAFYIYFTPKIEILLWGSNQNISCSILTWLGKTNTFLHFLESLRSWAIIKIKIKKLDGDNKCFSLILRTLIFFQKICKMLKTSMWDYEKLSGVTYPFYFINWQSIHKTHCMQTIKKILMWEVLPAIALNKLQVWQSVSHISYMVE